MPKLLRALVIPLLTVPLPTLAAETDVLRMRNGDRLTGELKGLTSGRLLFKTDATRTISVLWDHVAAVTSPNFFEVVLSSGERRFGVLLEPERPATLRVGPEGGVGDDQADYGLERVASIQRLRRGFWDRLEGSFDVGFSFTQADERRELNLAAVSEYRTRKWRFQVKADSLLRRQASSDDFDRDDLGFAATRFIGGRWLALTGVAVQRNTELEIDRRVIALTGAGYHVLRTVESDLIVSAGLALSTEEFSDGRTSSESLEVVISVLYDLYALGGNDFTVTFQGLVFPSLSVGGRFRSEVSLDLRKEVVSDVYLSLRGLYSTDNAGDDRAAATSRSDVNATLAVGWSF